MDKSTQDERGQRSEVRSESSISGFHCFLALVLVVVLEDEDEDEDDDEDEDEEERMRGESILLSLTSVL